MEKEYEYNGHRYWVTVELAVNSGTGNTAYVAYVSDKKPKGVLYGAAVKDPEGKTLFFGDQLTAFTNATAKKNRQLESK